MDFHTKKIISPEKKKENETKLKCKICGKKIVGKETLSRHIAHAHDEINQVRREKLVIDAYYGKSKVDQVISDFENGKYAKLADLPINVYKYINLAGIVKGGKVSKDDSSKDNGNIANDNEEISNITVDDVSKTLILKNFETKEKSYVEDALYDKSEDVLTLVSTSKFEEALTLEQLREFLEDKDISTKKLFVKKDGTVSTILSIEIINVDNGGEDSDNDSKSGYSQCVVAYSPQQSKSEKSDKD